MQDSGVRSFLSFESVLKEILKVKDGYRSMCKQLLTLKFLILQVFFY